jgi:hypothetical protein
MTSRRSPGRDLDHFIDRYRGPMLPSALHYTEPFWERLSRPILQTPALENPYFPREPADRLWSAVLVNGKGRPGYSLVRQLLVRRSEC